MGGGGRGSQPIQLCKREDVARHRQDNPFILAHYLPDDCTSLSASLLQLHNQSFNIWSHLLGLPLCLWLVCREIDRSQPFLSSAITIHALCGTICGLASAAYHALYAFPREQHYLMLRLDQAGAFLACSSHSFLIASFELADQPWLLFTCLLALSAITMRGIQVMLAGAGASAKEEATQIMAVPFLIGACAWLCSNSSESTEALVRISLTMFVATAVWVGKIPERWLPPGTLDRVGSSHNVMHVLVLLVFLQLQSHYDGLLHAQAAGLRGL